MLTNTVRLTEAQKMELLHNAYQVLRHLDTAQFHAAGDKAARRALEIVLADMGADPVDEASSAHARALIKAGIAGEQFESALDLTRPRAEAESPPVQRLRLLRPLATAEGGESGA